MIVTDQLRSYPAAKAEIPELANVRHVFIKAAAGLNNDAENSRQPTRERERRMRAFAILNAHRNFSRALGRSGNISRSSGICYALHSIETTRSAFRCVVRNRRSHPKFVDCFLITCRICRRPVSLSGS